MSGIEIQQIFIWGPFPRCLGNEFTLDSSTSRGIQGLKAKLRSEVAISQNFVVIDPF